MCFANDDEPTITEMLQQMKKLPCPQQYHQHIKTNHKAVIKYLNPATPNCCLKELIPNMQKQIFKSLWTKRRLQISQNFHLL